MFVTIVVSQHETRGDVSCQLFGASYWPKIKAKGAREVCQMSYPIPLLQVPGPLAAC